MVKWFSIRHEDDPVILDHGYLQRLGKHIGERETRELLADGMLDLTDRLAVLRRHGEDGNLKGVADLVHEIAGAAGHQGLTAMSHAAFEASRLVRENTDPDTDALAKLVLQYQDASLTALSQFCNGPSGDDVDG
ncbi:MAG: Hpt domain-containing protein [Pseudomonadota bacterium]